MCWCCFGAKAGTVSACGDVFPRRRRFFSACGDIYVFLKRLQRFFVRRRRFFQGYGDLLPAGGDVFTSRWVAGSRLCPDAAAQTKHQTNNSNKKTKPTAGTTPPAITRPGSFMTPFGVPPPHSDIYIPDFIPVSNLVSYHIPHNLM